MGERATGLDGTAVRSGTATDAASPRDQPRRLEGEISRLREELAGLMAELNRRRRHYPFSSFFSSLWKRQSVPWAMIFCGLALIIPASWRRRA
jgi:hypothetical protein